LGRDMKRLKKRRDQEGNAKKVKDEEKGKEGGK
jgi:hypothetical protein